MADKNPKKQHSIIISNINQVFQLILYIPLQIIFIPFAIIGFFDGVYREMCIGKKLGVSFSAGQALQYRWIMHYFNTRPDPLSVAFVKLFPCESHFGLWVTFGALIVSQRLFGFTTKFGKVDELGEETIFSTPGRRVLMFDSIMKKYVDEVEQIVLPGAGFDLISLNFTKGKEVRVFELDQVETMNIKVDTLKKAGIDHDWVTYIPVDYSNEFWEKKLLASGFDKTKKTLFLWQSVSLFLNDETVKETLRKMSNLSAEGSIIAQDFYSQAFISGEILKTVIRAKKLFKKMGEEWKFGIDMSNGSKNAVESFLLECGLHMTDHFQFGHKLNMEPFYCIVTAEK